MDNDRNITVDRSYFKREVDEEEADSLVKGIESKGRSTTQSLDELTEQAYVSMTDLAEFDFDQLTSDIKELDQIRFRAAESGEFDAERFQELVYTTTGVITDYNITVEQFKRLYANHPPNGSYRQPVASFLKENDMLVEVLYDLFAFVADVFDGSIDVEAEKYNVDEKFFSEGADMLFETALTAIRKVKSEATTFQHKMLKIARSRGNINISPVEYAHLAISIKAESWFYNLTEEPENEELLEPYYELSGISN